MYLVMHHTEVYVATADESRESQASKWAQYVA
jgi:hypothetical protein